MGTNTATIFRLRNCHKAMIKWIKRTLFYTKRSFKRKDWTVAITSVLIFPFFVWLTWYIERYEKA